MPTTDPVDAALERLRAHDEKQALRTGLRVTGEQAAELAPDTAERALKLSRTDGIPFAAAALQPASQPFDWAKLADDDPGLADLAVANPGFAAAIQKDAPALTRLGRSLEAAVRGLERGAEATVSAGIAFGQDLAGVYRKGSSPAYDALDKSIRDLNTNAVTNYEIGELQSELKVLAAEEFHGGKPLGAEKEARARALEEKLAQYQAQAKATSSAASWVTGNVAQQLQPMARRAKEGEPLAIAGLVVGAGLSAATGGTLPALVGGAATGLGLGVSTSQAVFGGEDEAVFAYRDMVNDFRQANGGEVTEEQRKAAHFWSSLVGVANGTLEIIPTAWLASKAPGIRQALAGQPIKDALRTMLRNPTKRAAMVRLAGRLGEGVVAEGGTEYLQEWNTILAEVAAKGGKAGDLVLALKDPKNREQAWDAGKAGAGAGIGFAFIPTAVSLRSDLQEAQAAESRVERLKAMGGDAKALAHLPEATRTYVERKIADGPVETVSVPAGAVRQLLQEEGVDVARAMPGLQKQIDSALAAGDPTTEVKIPLADFVSQIAPLKGFDSIADDVRVGDAKFTAREAREVKTEADKLLAEMQDAKELTPAQRVFEDVFKKVTGGGQQTEDVARQDAAIWAAMAQSRASRGLAKDAWDYYQKQTLMVKNSATDEVLVGDGVTTLNQRNAAKSVRGSVTFDDTRAWFSVTLTGKANLSTFLHESGHAFFEMLQRDAGGGHAESAADVATLRLWLGAGKEGPLTEAQLEQFARGFEAYLWEGKAPSADLQDVFGRIKLWMRQIYATIAQLAPLTDEVRGVFDRLVATDEQIRRSADQLHLTEQFAGDDKARALQEKALAQAHQNLEQAHIAALRHVVQNELEATKAKVTEEVNADNAYNAQAILMDGESLDGRPVPEALKGRKLNAPLVKAMGLSKDQLRRLKPLLGGDRTVTDTEAGTVEEFKAITPDEAALFLGYNDGIELVTALGGLEPRAKKIAQETKARMAEKYPAFEMSPTWLEEHALKELHSDAVATALLADLDAVGKQLGQPPGRSVKAVIRQAAAKAVAQETVLELDPQRHRRAESQAAAEFAEALAGKKFAEAWAAKRRQLYHHFAWIESTKAKDEVEKIRVYLKGLTDIRAQRRLGLAGQQYLEAINALLGHFSFKKDSAKSLRRGQSFSAFLAAEAAAGTPLAVAPEVIAEMERKAGSYKHLTLEEMRALEDAARNTEHMAKTKAKLMLAKERRDFAKTTEDMAAHIEENAGAAFAEKPGDPQSATRIAKLKASLRSMSATLKKMEFICRTLDGGKTAGFIHSLLFQPFRDAARRQNEMLEQVVKRLGDLFQGLSNADRRRFDTRVDFLGTPMKLSEVLSLALNTGNEGNISRLLGGYRYRGWTEAQVFARLDELLTDRDIKLLHDIWETVDSLWPEIKALQERTVGVAPRRVEKQPHTLPSGRVLKGGYFPIVKDRSRSHLGEKMAQRSEDLFQDSYHGATMEMGFTKPRAEKNPEPLLLDLAVIPRHMTNVIHYVTHYEAVQGVQKIINSTKVSAAIKNAIGKEAHDTIHPWLQAVAKGSADLGQQDWWDRQLRNLRFGSSLVMYGFKVTTGLMQALGVLSAAKEVGVGPTVRGVAKFMVDLKNGHPFAEADAQSDLIKHIDRNVDRDIAQRFEEHLGAFGQWAHIQDQLAHFSLAWMMLVQKSVNTITFHAAMERAQDEGHPDPVAYAESVVAMSQSSANIMDLAPIQRSTEFKKTIVVAYSYFSILYNQLVEPLTAEGAPARCAQAAARWWWLVTVPVLAQAALKGKGPDKGDEPDDWAKWLLLEQLSYAGRGLPVVGSIAEAASGREQGGAPWVQALYQGAKGLGSARDGKLTPGEKRAIVTMVGTVLKQPTGSAYNAVKFMDKLDTMEDPVRNALFRSPGEWK